MGKSKRNPTPMTSFSKQDIEHFLADFMLYSGNIRKFKRVCGPWPHNDSVYGSAVTSMDEFNFSVSPMFCDDECWVVHLADPDASLRQGARMVSFFDVPKIHLRPELKKKYEMANYVYWSYGSFDGMCEDRRLATEELALGYAGLSNYSKVMNAILNDFRSYKKVRKELTAKQRRIIAKLIKEQEKNRK